MPGWTPVPLRVTLSTLEAALLGIFSLPLSGPVTLGLKVTSTAQLAPGATLADEQVSALMAKSPVIVTPPTSSGRLPVLVTLTVWAALAEPKT